MRIYPDEAEGVLSKWRAALVNEASLAERAGSLALSQFLRVGRGESAAQAASRPRLVASAFEALVGAIFCDGGWEPAHAFVTETFAESLRYVSATADFEGDYKTRLQEIVQKENHAPPDYKILRTEGPDHSKTFFVEVSIRGEPLGVGQGSSRKQAEQQAAKVVLEMKALEKKR